MSGMAEVLTAHWSRSTHTDSEPFVDKCDGCGAVVYSWGDETAPHGIEPLAAHQEAMLTAAGFGELAPAWQQGMEHALTWLGERDMAPAFRKDNPYRAAAVRGEG